MLNNNKISYLAFTNELNVAQKEKNIDEWLILLKNTILLMKSQLVTSYLNTNRDVSATKSIKKIKCSRQ
jgi:hypothetical protein